MPRPILVLDFDGTVCLGDDPVLLYADEVARRVPEPHSTAIRCGVRDFLGQSGSIDLPGVDDGYHAVAALAEPSGIDQTAADAAYAASRSRIEAGQAHIYAPVGLDALLTDLRTLGVYVVLVTNSPLIGIAEWLESVGLIHRIDQVIPDAGKPSQMAAILGDLLTRGFATHRPELLLSVGDVWANDVQPALDLGCVGLYIDRFNSRRGAVGQRAPTFVDLFDRVRAWAVQSMSVAESSPNRNI